MGPCRATTRSAAKNGRIMCLASPLTPPGGSTPQRLDQSGRVFHARFRDVRQSGAQRLSRSRHFGRGSRIGEGCLLRRTRARCAFGPMCSMFSTALSMALPMRTYRQSNFRSDYDHHQQLCDRPRHAAGVSAFGQDVVLGPEARQDWCAAVIHLCRVPATCSAVRAMPSFCMRDCSVVRFSPNLAAAPAAPPLPNSIHVTHAGYARARLPRA